MASFFPFRWAISEAVKYILEPALSAKKVVHIFPVPRRLLREPCVIVAKRQNCRNAFSVFTEEDQKTSARDSNNEFLFRAQIYEEKKKDNVDKAQVRQSLSTRTLSTSFPSGAKVCPKSQFSYNSGFCSNPSFSNSFFWKLFSYSWLMPAFRFYGRYAKWIFVHRGGKKNF